MKFLLLAAVLTIAACGQASEGEVKNAVKATVVEIIQDPKILSHAVDLKKNELAFFHKNENGVNFKNHKNLREWLEKKKQRLIFAVNGGMYNKDGSPQGLYIEDGKVIKELQDKKKGYGNFFLQPNGIFYIDNNNHAKVVTTDQLKDQSQIKYATQSGPMLLIDGKTHPAFKKGSKNIHIRNGVGILPNGNILFAMSKEKINFYDFADYFKKNKCKNALYLDGFVSRTYLPSENWIQEDGNFGVIIAEI